MNLDNIKEGDPIALYSVGFLELCYAGRCTNTCIIIGRKQFIRKSGREVERSMWSGSWIEPWTAEHDKKLAEQESKRRLSRAIKKLINYNWHSITQEQADAIFIAMEVVGLVDQ